MLCYFVMIFLDDFLWCICFSYSGFRREFASDSVYASAGGSDSLNAREGGSDSVYASAGGSRSVVYADRGGRYNQSGGSRRHLDPYPRVKPVSLLFQRRI